MPFFKRKFFHHKIIFFLHIPKCGGSSIEKFFIDNNFYVNLLDKKFENREIKWSKNSPQHLISRDLKTIIDLNMIDYSFTVIRHPIERFKSAFLFNKNVNKIMIKLDINDFVNHYEKKFMGLYSYDNHFIPANKFIEGFDRKLEIYRLEELSKLESKLNRLFHYTLKLRKLEHLKKSSTLPYQETPNLSTRSKEIIYELYKEDFKKFGYKLRI